MFRAHITSRVENREYIGVERLRIMFQSICLRRTKDTLDLPEPRLVTHAIEFSKKSEGEAYHQIGAAAKQLIDDVVHGRTSMKTYGVILQTITRLRIFCNHGTLDSSFVGAPSRQAVGEDTLESLQKENGAVCAVCDDILSAENQGDEGAGSCIPCSHLLCQDCLADYQNKLELTEGMKKRKCPICGKVISPDQECTPAEDQDLAVRLNKSGHSSKLQRLVQDILEFQYSDKR